ncbi:3,4-dihydroxy-2-butanone 4-phosphate synthase [Wallemia mellicola]|nr:3,4-dihydroxy-2-butanone 4-phosphate synthase [Wallemia mellicola]
MSSEERKYNALSKEPYPDNVKTSFDSVKDAVEAYKNGEFVIVMDDEGRENEGDLVIPACGITAEQMAWMIKWTSGYICISLEEERLRELDIPMMTGENTEKHRTAYTVTVDYLQGVTTGISAADRALTARMLSPSSGAVASDFNRPGHMVPLRYHAGGTTQREGHTESATDLAILAGLPPAGLLCEIVNPDAPDGSMARLDDCFKFAGRWDIPIITVKMIKQAIENRSL